MTTAEPATEVRAIPTYIAIPASKVLGEGLVVLGVVALDPAVTVYRTVVVVGTKALLTSMP